MQSLPSPSVIICPPAWAAPDGSAGTGGSARGDPTDASSSSEMLSRQAASRYRACSEHPLRPWQKLDTSSVTKILKERRLGFPPWPRPSSMGLQAPPPLPPATNIPVGAPGPGHTTKSQTGPLKTTEMDCLRVQGARSPTSVLLGRNQVSTRFVLLWGSRQ